MIKGGGISPPTPGAVPEEDPRPRLLLRASTTAAPRRQAGRGQPELTGSSPQPSSQRCVRPPWPDAAPREPKPYALTWEALDASSNPAWPQRRLHSFLPRAAAFALRQAAGFSGN